MPSVSSYNRKKAVDYADKWALSRNPRYLDFSELGGDCTNFCSQCLYAGSGTMNYTPVYGWYYTDSYNRSASWTGVNYLFNFLTSNKKKGPFAVQTDASGMELGDLIQLGRVSEPFHHSLIITKIDGPSSIDTIYISTHTFDFHNRPLNKYEFDKIRFLHIMGVYK
jgi:hypothetical protein